MTQAEAVSSTVCPVVPVTRAALPRRAGARALVEDFPNPHGWSKRPTKRRGRPARITDAVIFETLDVLAALAASFVPVSAGPEGTVFLAALPSGLEERLAALGAEMEDREPSLGALEGFASANQEGWGFRSPVLDGEEDAGEMPEIDAGDEPELDPAESGLADADALHLWLQEEEVLTHFWRYRETAPDLNLLRESLRPLARARRLRTLSAAADREA